MGLLESLPGTLVSMALFYFVLGVGTVIEGLRPLERHAPSEVRMTYAIGLWSWFAAWLLGPLSSAAAVAITNALGAGLIPLSDDGWMIVPSLLVYLVARDLLEYWMHRAQHAVPFLWKMHSLHHSEEAFAARTGARAFWLEAAIRSAIGYPLLAVLFKVPASILFITLVIYLINPVFVHLNTRVSFGRFSLWLQGPHYHRIHHSTDPKHFDKNFCALFPVFDVVFGTAWNPAHDEYPATGLSPSEKPATFLESVIWPLRGSLLRRQAE